MPEAETASGQYMYCLIRCAEPRPFSHRGIGERGDTVYSVNYDDLAAVVSDSPIVEYESSRRNLMAHTLVLEEVMREFTILPVRFGTIAPSAEAIREKVLKRRFGEFQGLFHAMAGHVELGLKAFWYEEVIFREIVAENPPIRQLRDGLAGRPQEGTYYERIRLGELIENAMWKKRDADAERVLARLRTLADQTQVNKPMTDKMVLNAAFLLPGSRQPEFDAAVKKLDEEMGKRLIFKYVGPVPPYNFVNIVIGWNEEE